MIAVQSVTKQFKKKMALAGVDCTFETNKTYGLLGPNGAGKTTLLRCITTLYRPTSGDIQYQDKSIYDTPRYINEIGYLPQSFGMFPHLTVQEMMRFFACQKEVPKQAVEREISDSLELVNMQESLNRPIRTLSGGMVRRLGIAQALLNKPPFVILDEPTAGLDPEERVRFKNIISSIKKACTVIISTHIVEDVEALCDLILIMNEGKVVQAGTVTEMEALAEGKVFEIEDRRKDELQGAYYVERQFERDGAPYLKILSSAPQNAAKLINASVEDGYLCALKEI